MDKGTKVNILYKISMGQSVNLSSIEKKELSKYKVSHVGKPLTTKRNISEYISAVDKGYYKSFFDWCMDNHKGDRRTKKGSAEYIKGYESGQNIGIMCFGWWTWGIAIYWLFQEAFSVGQCAIVGAIVSVIIYRLNREIAGFTCIFLPIILLSIFG